MDNDFRYISFGAGVQSTALLVLSALELKGVPKADCAIFADTGDEPPWVYDTLEYMKEWSDIPIYETSKGMLSANVLSNGKFVPIPVFSQRAESAGENQLRRQCTREYKITPIEKKVRELLGYNKGQRVKHTATAMIGISLDEATRMKESRTNWVKNEYPLVDIGFRRGNCIKLLQEYGIPVPKKSSCTYCPYHSNAYWRDLKHNYPELWTGVTIFDHQIRELSMQGADKPVYLHRSLLPMANVDLSEDQTDLFESECEGYCGV